jgi:O-antigen ligase
VVWPLAAFGGTSETIAIPFGLACVALAVAVRPRIGGALDLALLSVMGLIALQAVPLPASVSGILSPSSGAVRQALALGNAAEPGRFQPLTIDVSSTLWALVVVAAAVAIFFLARATFDRGGVRRTVRLVAGVGFGVSLLAIAQAATAGRDIYWRFPTEFEGPLPFGPFINRNHFATWAIMAVPLCFGYLAARSGSGPDYPNHISRRTRLVDLIDPRSAWLVAAIVIMLAALLLSLSRSGTLALGASAVITAFLVRHQLDRRRRRAVLATSAVVILLGLAWADVPRLRARFAGAQTGVSGRVQIWKETLPVVRDFWLTGSGAGTYSRALLVYQRSNRSLMFNQAHNHYLQVAAEGGLLLSAAIALALGAFLRTARQRLLEDSAGLVWIRTGALCGLGAVALQSVWETGLVMPANGALAAVLAAIVAARKV